MPKSNKLHAATLCAHLGRGDGEKPSFVNPPSTRGSSYLYPSVQAYREGLSSPNTPQKLAYGRYGSQTTRELEAAVAHLDGAFGAMITSSGFSAISTAIMAFIGSGDHILMADTVYAPTRIFGEKTLKRFNVEASFYSADISTPIEEIEALIQPNTKLIFLESPGSITFEIQDIQAIITLAKKHNIVTIMDNTWATSIHYPAIENGIHVSIQAATKYIGGHSDLMMGIITTDEAHWPAVRQSYIEFGHSPGTEETMLALRGLRTLECRLKQQGESALNIAHWLEEQDEVDELFFPAMPSSPYHALFNAQFKGTSSLFAFTLKTDNQTAVAAMLDTLSIISIGESWAGFESLILPLDPSNLRTAKPWKPTGQLIRLAVGLEHPDDLINDLDAGFTRLNAALTT
ncbi:MAG: cystathionine beta-lyase [Arenicellales bacterium]